MDRPSYFADRQEMTRSGCIRSAYGIWCYSTRLVPFNLAYLKLNIHLERTNSQRVKRALTKLKWFLELVTRWKTSSHLHGPCLRIMFEGIPYSLQTSTEPNKHHLKELSFLGASFFRFPPFIRRGVKVMPRRVHVRTMAPLVFCRTLANAR